MRRRAGKRSVQFSLFPFLAVLLCTMGSLIVLLLVLVQQARVEANEQSVTVPSDVPPKADVEADESQSQVDEEHIQKLDEMSAKLGALRSELENELQDSQFQLSHLEDHVRRLVDQLAQLKADYDVLTQEEQQDASERQQKRIELNQLKEKIAAARAELEQAKQTADAKPRSYAIVPYDGPRGTRRRPIYLECQVDKLVIQPEGHIVLIDEMQAAGPGNPLAAALRATREHLLKTGALRGGEPYPLLLVRPDGARTYSAARSAMSTWGSEYGYELIDADMPLEFPPADEALAHSVREAMSLARHMQQAVAEYQSQRGSGTGHRNSGVGSSTTGTGRSPGGTYLAPSRNGGFEVRGAGGKDWLDQHVARPGQSSGDQQNGLPSGDNSQNGIRGSGATSQNAVPLASSTTPPPSSAGGGFYPTEQPGTNFQANRMSGNSPHEQQATGAVLGGAQASQEGEGIALPFTPPNGSSADTQTNPASNVAPVAQSRGGGWALPASAQGATPFRRPIRVVVKGDQLLILPDRGDQSGARVVPLNGPMQRTIDHFVAQIWEHMNGWGIAGAYAYWKPILSVEIAPGGEARFAELAALMQQSGVEVERK